MPGAIHPTRYPGANVLDTAPHHKTSPFLSKALQGLGRELPKNKSPYKSSSIKGISYPASISTTTLLCSSGIQLPNGLLKLLISRQALICGKTFFSASGSIPVTGLVGNSNIRNPILLANCNIPK